MTHHITCYLRRWSTAIYAVVPITASARGWLAAGLKARVKTATA